MNDNYKPKPKRFETNNAARFLTFGCNKRKRLFRFTPLCEYFTSRLQQSSQKNSIEIWAFVIMSNHIHLLLYSTNDYPIRQFISNIKQKFSYDAVNWLNANNACIINDLKVEEGNRVINRIWQKGGGYDSALLYPEKILKCIEYIHNNPVRSGMVIDPLDFQWSSAREWASGNYNIINPQSFKI